MPGIAAAAMRRSRSLFCSVMFSNNVERLEKRAIKPPHCQSFKTVLHFFLCIPIPGLHPLRIDGGHMAKKAKKAKKTVAKKAKKAAKKK